MAVRKTVKRTTRTASRVKKETPAPVSSVSYAPVVNKLKQPRVLIGLVVVILLVGAYLLRGLFFVAFVNGEPITRVAVVSELEKQGGKQALSSLINQTLIFQEARKKKVTVSQSELDASLKQIEDSLKAQGQSLDTALAMQGMTRDDLTTQLKLRTLVEKLLADKVKVSPAEIADYISKNKDSLPTGQNPDQLNKTVEEQLKQQKLGTESQTWLAGLTKNAKINYIVNY